ncbi:uncharacterized protein LOC122499583 isoform X1 [Leptopilina heterotoma]|uniref:uncharacterized protein LOC122499583 isoform X1 n=1 Tax=Leptopilina heterotoma TaxID=63436 RepID=UPI001CA9612B|nr:uncharacterized protein LOC122499583 isoform X1 [Leptopilina heterotoma]
MFTCNICHLQLPAINLYNKHQLSHANVSENLFVCLYENCKKTFIYYKNFRDHCNRMHCISEKQGVLLSMKFFCRQSNCKFYSTSESVLKKHLLNHINKVSPTITCTHPNCPKFSKPFFTKNAFKIHLYRCHKGKIHNGVINTQETAFDVNFEEIFEENDFSIIDSDNLYDNANINKIDSGGVLNDNSILVDQSKEKKNYVNDGTKHLAKTYMLLSAKHFTSDVSLQASISSISSFVQTCSNAFKAEIERSNFSETEKKDILSIFKNSFKSWNIAHDSETSVLRSTHCRKKFYENNFSFVEPIQIPLSENSKFYHYVPIIETIKMMLLQENVRKYCFGPLTSNNNNVFADIKDGKVIKNNPFFRDGALQIILFQDAFEICNPLGSSKGKFKLVGIYMNLGNLPPFLRSKADSWKLVALCKEKYVNEFGWTIFLKRLISDLQLLESEGIPITVDGVEKRIFASLVAVLGDNLGSSEIGCFTKNFSKSTYFCRFCNITRKSLLSNDFTINDLRNRWSYTVCSRNAEKTKKLCLGVSGNSPLNCLKHFHVCNPGLPPCIAHDLYEGIVPYDLMLIVKDLLKKRWFRIGYLNFHIQNIKLSTDPSGDNVPIINIKKNKISGTATEVRKLLLIFPLAIAHAIKNSEDKVWNMVLLLRKISSLVCAPALSIGQVALLQSVINEYLNLRIECFPMVPLRPKHHFIAHYPSLIEEFGPLKHVCTLRGESKHQFFKSLIRHTENFKNVTKTLSEKHQIMSCFHTFDEDSVKAFDAAEFNLENFQKSVAEVIKSFMKSNNTFYYVASKISFRGINYCENMSLCVGVCETGNFRVLKIKHILFNKRCDTLYFVGFTNEIVENDQLGIFEIKKKGNDSNLSIVPYSSLLSPDPLPEILLLRTTVIVPKYEPLNPLL